LIKDLKEQVADQQGSHHSFVFKIKNGDLCRRQWKFGKDKGKMVTQ